MFFDSWYDLLRIVAVGALTYVALVMILRVFGKRTLSKMNAFDFVVTIAMGSTLASALLSSEVSVSEAALALLLLASLQFLVSWGTQRSRRFERLVKSEPALLFYRGRFLEDALRHERISEDEVLAAVRAAGHAHLERVDAVVLETDGTITAVTGKAPPGGRSTVEELTRAR